MKARRSVAGFSGETWCLHEAIAWLTTESAVEVAAVSAKLSDATSDTGDVFPLAWMALAYRIKGAGCIDLTLVDDQSADAVLSVARDVLTEGCLAGKVRAFGRRHGAACASEIDPSEFEQASLGHWRDLALYQHVVTAENAIRDEAVWSEVKFAARDVRRLAKNGDLRSFYGARSRGASRLQPTSPSWVAWVANYRSLNPKLPDVDRVIYPAAKAYFGDRVTQQLVRDTFGGLARGPRK